MSNSRTLDGQPLRFGGRILGALATSRAASAVASLASGFSRWLDGDPLAFSRRPLAPLELERVRAAQLALRGAWAVRAAAVLGATILPLGMWNTAVRAPLVLWELALIANLALSYVMRARGGDDDRAARAATLRAILNGAIWAFGLALAQSEADAGQRALIAALAMSVMSGGALRLVFSPPMACGFIAPLALGCAFAAWNGRDAAAPQILAAQLLNAGFLVSQAHFQATELAKGAIAHFADAVAARLDRLTGLGNRLGLSERLAVAFAGPGEGGQGFALMCFDLDGFQLVNDTFGHRAGDELILRAAQALRSASGEGDYVARLGGDEFALLAVRATKREAAQELAQRIAAEFRRPYPFSWGDSACPVTIGVALAPEHGQDGDHLARGADAALFRARQHGCGSIAFADDAESWEARERRETEKALRQALRNGEMRLDFQPLVDAASGVTNGFEALLRWRRPGHPEASASLFIGAAESSGCLEEIGLWALREATRVASTWPKRLRVAVNVSAAQLKSPSLLATVRDIVEGGGFEGGRLELEIAESSLIEDFEAAAASFNALRRHGVAIALDDFGARFSSMNAIASLPLDRIKIGRAFVAEALVNPRCTAVIRLAARLAKELGLALTGEGVETFEQFELLRSAGCDEAQGYFFSRPASAEALPALFQRCPVAAPAAGLRAGTACQDCVTPWCVEAGMCRRAVATF